jgi:hypothetical protein
MDKAKILNDVQAAADSVVWRKTIYVSPHEYIIREKVREAWEKIADAIDNLGVIEEFGGRPYKYLKMNGYRYWHYQKVLNRAELVLQDDSR